MKKSKKIIVNGFLGACTRHVYGKGDLTVLNDVLDTHGHKAISWDSLKKIAKELGYEVEVELDCLSGPYGFTVLDRSLISIFDAINICDSQSDGKSDEYAEMWKHIAMVLKNDKKIIESLRRVLSKVD